MRILYFGDVYAKPGRDALFKAMDKIIAAKGADFVVVNAENAAHGNGVTPELAEEMISRGVDVLTTGNHAWDQKAIIPWMATSTRIIRPANYPDHPAHRVPGRGSTVVESKRTPGLKLGVIQVMGRVFMDAMDCPFRAADRELERLENVGIENILVDFHGEASSEKQAFAHYMDGRVGAVVGSHSHVQTADERILPGGTAAITDVGMTGCFDSVIGVKKEISIQRFLTKRHLKYEPAEGPGGYGCVWIQFDSNGNALKIERFREALI